MCVEIGRLAFVIMLMCGVRTLELKASLIWLIVLEGRSAMYWL